MYFDTDSDIYIHPNGDGPQMIEKGDKLEDITTEVRHPEAISDFFFGGPKNYSFSVLTEDS